MALILDTGPIFASLDRRDRHHDRCAALIRSARELMVIPAPVLVEVDQLLSSRGYLDVMSGLLADIVDGGYAVEDLIQLDYRRVRDLCDRYADSDIGFVDAAVLAIVERLNEPKLATLDHRHFGMLRPRHVESLRLLPE